jgi:hypothetical protein
MNVRRGLVRTWVVLTILWIVAMGNNNVKGVNFADWWTVMWLFVMPPVALAILLVAVGWIIAGFRGNPST